MVQIHWGHHASLLMHCTPKVMNMIITTTADVHGSKHNTYNNTPSYNTSMMPVIILIDMMIRSHDLALTLIYWGMARMDPQLNEGVGGNLPGGRSIDSPSQTGSTCSILGTAWYRGN